MLLSNNFYDNHGIHDNIMLSDITILKISLRYRLSWHFNIMINDNIVILPNSNVRILFPKRYVITVILLLLLLQEDLVNERALEGDC